MHEKERKERTGLVNFSTKRNKSQPPPSTLPRLRSTSLSSIHPISHQIQSFIIQPSLPFPPFRHPTSSVVVFISVHSFSRIHQVRVRRNRIQNQEEKADPDDPVLHLRYTLPLSHPTIAIQTSVLDLPSNSEASSALSKPVRCKDRSSIDLPSLRNGLRSGLKCKKELISKDGGRYNQASTPIYSSSQAQAQTSQ